MPDPGRLAPPEGGGVEVLALEGWENAAAPGQALLPQRVFLVAVPPTGAVRVSGRGSAHQALDSVAVAAQPAPPRDLREPARLERAGADAAPPLARLLDVSWMRNQRVARVAVSPAAWEARAGRMTVARRVEVEVEVEPAAETGRPFEDPDPFEEVYRGTLVNYEDGRRWRRAHGAEAGEIPVLAPLTVDTTSVFVGRRWVRITIPRTGFYRVDFGALRLLEPFSGGIEPPVDSLRLFTLPGFPVLTERAICDTCDLREVAIGIVDDGDGRLDSNDDGFTFFALGASDWADLYDPAQPDTVFINHPYDTRNYYYLTLSNAGLGSEPPPPLPGSPRRIAQVAGTVVEDGTEIVPATVPARAHFEIDSPTEYFPDPTAVGTTMFWEKWYWRSLLIENSFSTSFDLPGVDSTAAARLRLRLWGIATTTCRGCVCPLLDPAAHLTDVAMNDQAVGTYRWGNRDYREGMVPFTVDAPAATRSRGNRLTVSLPPLPCSNTNRVDRQAVAWFDVFYPRRLEPVRDVLAFDSPPAAGNYLFRIGPFTGASPPRVFDVTDPHDPAEIVPGRWETGAGGYTLSFETVQSGVRRYRVIRDTSIVELGGSSLVEVRGDENLRSPGQGAEYVIVYWDGFAAAADSLRAWRDEPGRPAKAVPISQLYDQFSGGRTDPAAIRNMLRAAYRRWSPRPVYVTFLGDASYDFKNYKGRAPAGQPGTLVPSYENGFDAAVLRQYATDDWLLDVAAGTGGAIPDFFGARLPAGDAASAMDVVRKVIRYEREATLGEYRNRILLLADDAEQGSRPDDLEWSHVLQTTKLDQENTPLHIDRVYVYLHTYPDEAADTKPQAKADLIRNLNEQGVTLFNYVGHGSPFQLSDERVFLDTDVGSLVNADRLPLFVAASCDVGKFNDATVLSLGERLVTRPGGGAIGVISATELAFSWQNSTLNQRIYDELFRRDPASGQYRTPMSAALLRAKTSSENSQKYQLLGDARSVLHLPRLTAELALLDSAGTTPVPRLVQGRTLTVRGRMLDRPGGTQVPFDGIASLLVEDSAPIETTPDCPLDPGCYPRQYAFRAGPIYRGNVSVAGGAFEGRFVVPLDARVGPRSRLRVYATGTRGGLPDDGAGALRDTLVAGTAPAGDQEGPRITLSFQGGATTVRPDAVLQVLLHDPSGILITGHTPQNGIIVTIDEQSTARYDITASFRYTAGSYQSGIATFTLPSLAPGPHRIRVSAADNLAAGFASVAHRSSAVLDFEVSALPDLRVAQAFLFPNPIVSGGRGGGGQFVIDAPGDPVNVLIRIYTVTGRVIQELRSSGGQGHIQVPWDGRDAEGQELANGVYLFKVHVNVREPDGRSSARQRGQAEGRFVVVGH